MSADTTYSRSRAARKISRITADATPGSDPPRRRADLIVPTYATPWQDIADPRTHIVSGKLVAVPTASPFRSASK